MTYNFIATINLLDGDEAFEEYENFTMDEVVSKISEEYQWTSLVLVVVRNDASVRQAND